jgi:hypothetical protein
MTGPYGGPFNQAGGSASVGMQAQYVTITGDYKVTAAPGDPPEKKYEAGVANLRSRNQEQSRALIWNAMMDWEASQNGQVTSEVLFHWLVAMLSGRTVRQFSEEELHQLRHFQYLGPKAEGDEWAEGTRLIYQLLDSALRSQVNGNRPETSMSFLISQFDKLGKEQRKLLRPLDLFLSGPRKDELWRDELQRARAAQRSVDRLTHAWMFFHPDPARVVLPEPAAERGDVSDRRWMRASAILFAALAGSVGLELLWQGNVLALLGYVAGLAGGIIAAAGDLETRPRPERPHPPLPTAHPGDKLDRELSKQIDKLFNTYSERREPVQAGRKLFEEATAGARRFYRSEITAICRANGYFADQVAWLIRHEVRQMHQRWRDGSPQFPRYRPAPKREAVTGHWAGLAVLALGFTLAALTAHRHLLGFTVILLSAAWAWRRWLRVSLKRGGSEEHALRQQEIDEERRRWAARLESRPKDAQMAEWLQDDRTALLGMALDRFRLSRSRLVAHGFIEKPAPFAKRSQIDGGLPRYQRYQVWMFLMAEDGVHQLRASLNFLTGSLVDREDITYGYSSIASIRTVRKSGGVRTHEISLTAGEPITVQVRETDPRPVTQDEKDDDTEPATETGSVLEDPAPDVASVTNTLNLLQSVVREGRNWLREHKWANAWGEAQAG